MPPPCSALTLLKSPQIAVLPSTLASPARNLLLATSCPRKLHWQRHNSFPGSCLFRGPCANSFVVRALKDAAESAVPQRSLYDASPVHSVGKLKVSEFHTLHYEEYGKPDGKHALVLHGGPGAGCYPNHARMFDTNKWRVVLVDQRGCGKSTPSGCLVENTTQALVADCERLRQHLGIADWVVLGGSWGSTLAVAYAITHPDRIAGIILRGVCLMRPCELDWMYKGGAAALQPKGWIDFLSHLTPAEQQDPLRSYYARLTSDHAPTRDAAARAWLSYEMAVVAQARLEAHYSINGAFLTEPPLLAGIDRIRHIPCIAVQGRLDFVCPVRTAYDLHCAWPEMELRVVPDAGHSMYDSRITHELVCATERMRHVRRRKSEKEIAAVHAAA
ncbi:hypothetical protein WJX72_000641 [[Myrmecia] bisecta]|uniref:Proline iminopeptidase n=1 Tax=[Myrmecia] bisecta TaxID=41462 RepID=A0AAW1R4T4_9CHLO